MQPRADSRVPADAALPWPAARKRRAALLLAFVRERGTVHPRDVDAHFAHGTVRNYWGGSSNATTHLLDAMHYQGMLRVVRRENGIRLYAAHEHAPAPADPELCRHRLDALVDAAVGIYAPLTGTGLASFVRRLRFAAPQWTRQLPAALKRAKQRLAHERVEGIDWYWPAGESAGRHEPPDAARLLTPFDPVTRDRGRFELLWGWVYRFEAYTPKRKRKLGYYALPLLWRDRVIGWGNASVENGRLEISLGYVAGRPPRERAFRREIEAERARLAAFLSLES